MNCAWSWAQQTTQRSHDQNNDTRKSRPKQQLGEKTTATKTTGRMTRTVLKCPFLNVPDVWAKAAWRIDVGVTTCRSITLTRQ